MIYNIRIEEILARVIRVEADSKEDAIQKAWDRYRNFDIVLDADDFDFCEIDCIDNINN